MRDAEEIWTDFESSTTGELHAPLSNCKLQSNAYEQTFPKSEDDAKETLELNWDWSMNGHKELVSNLHPPTGHKAFVECYKREINAARGF